MGKPEKNPSFSKVLELSPGTDIHNWTIDDRGTQATRALRRHGARTIPSGSVAALSAAAER